jgi:hypothetical protein
MPGELPLKSRALQVGFCCVVSVLVFLKFDVDLIGVVRMERSCIIIIITTTTTTTTTNSPVMQSITRRILLRLRFELGHVLRGKCW